MDAAFEVTIRPELKNVCNVDCDALWIRLDPLPIAVRVTRVCGDLKGCNGLAEEERLQASAAGLYHEEVKTYETSKVSVALRIQVLVRSVLLCGSCSVYHVP